MDKFLEALQLAQEQKNDEAYEILSNIIASAPMHFDARYARAMIDISHIKKHSKVTIEDLTFLIQKRTKYTKAAYTFLTLVYDGLEQIDEVIIYGEQAMKKDAPFKEEVSFALARAYARKETDASLNKALEYINICLENEESDEAFNYNICKADILASLKRLDEASDMTSYIAQNFGYSGVLYYIKARIAMFRYHTSNQKEDLEDAIDNAKITLQYEENDFLAKNLLIEAYTINQEYDNALNVIDSLKDECSLEDITIEKIKVYDEKKDINKCLELIDEALKTNNESWRLHYMKGVFFIETEETEENLKLAIDCFKKAYSYYQNVNILNDILKINKTIKDDQDNYDYLLSLLDTANKGEIYYYLADAANRIGKTCDEINSYYLKSKECGYIEEIEYLDLVCNFTENPLEFSKQLKKYAKKLITEIPIWSKRKIAIRYVYGEDGFKINFKKAEKLLIECLQEEDTNPCMNSMYGRLQELKKDNNKAYSYYQKSFELLKDTKYIDCDCAYGYYAHALYNGIGVKENIDLAKETILEAISISDKFTCSHIAYYYAYFYLQGDERFSANKALEILEFNYPFYRYDISRIVYLKKMTEKLNCNSKKLEELLSNNLKEYSKEEQKYYHNSIIEELPKPYWKNI